MGVGGNRHAPAALPHEKKSRNPLYRGADKEGNKLQRQKILMFIYPIYNHNWRDISTIYTGVLISP